MGIGQEVLDVPIGEMVYQLASAIATSQAELDRSSIDVMRIMCDKTNAPVHIPMLDDKGAEMELETSMVGAGFQPSFYQFSDAIIEVKMAITSSRETASERNETVDYGPSSKTTLYRDAKGKIAISQTKIKASTMNATYTSKYNFSEEATSSIRVRLVPLPPNPIMQRFIELRAQKQQLGFELEIKKAELALKAEEDKNRGKA
jgi:hypothetical protein